MFRRPIGAVYSITPSSFRERIFYVLRVKGVPVFARGITNGLDTSKCDANRRFDILDRDWAPHRTPPRAASSPTGALAVRFFPNVARIPAHAAQFIVLRDDPESAACVAAVVVGDMSAP